MILSLLLCIVVFGGSVVSAYEIINTLVSSPQEADELCMDTFETHLASVHSVSDESKVISLCSSGICWVGAYGDLSNADCSWSWYDGSSIDYDIDDIDMNDCDNAKPYLCAALNAAGFYKCDGNDQGFPICNSYTKVNNGWILGLTLGGSDDSYNGKNIDIGGHAFNYIFQNSQHHIIKRECESCDDTHKYIYYRRLTDTETFDAYNYMIDWSSDNNTIENGDFILTSTLRDALDETNPWLFCNYDDGYGAFRDCDPSSAGMAVNQWTANYWSFPGNNISGNNSSRSFIEPQSTQFLIYTGNSTDFTLLTDTDLMDEPLPWSEYNALWKQPPNSSAAWFECDEGFVIGGFLKMNATECVESDLSCLNEMMCVRPSIPCIISQTCVVIDVSLTSAPSTFECPDGYFVTGIYTECSDEMSECGLDDLRKLQCCQFDTDELIYTEEQSEHNWASCFDASNYRLCDVDDTEYITGFTKSDGNKITALESAKTRQIQRYHNPNAPTNFLCETESWNILNGSWDFDACNCNLETEDMNSVVWFGSADGLNPDTYFMSDEFTIKLTFSIWSYDGEVGIIIREPSDDIFDTAYYISIRTNGTENDVTFHEQQNGGDWTPIKTYYIGNINISYNETSEYKFKIVALESVNDNTIYDVYLNNKLVLEDIIVPKLSSASIGITTFDAAATFYSLQYKAKLDVAGNIGWLSFDLNDDTESGGSTAQQQPITANVHSGGLNPLRLFCAAKEDWPLWGALAAMDQQVLDELMGVTEEGAVGAVIDYIKCSEVVYSFIGNLQNNVLRPPASAIDLANMILERIQILPGIGDDIGAAADELSKKIIKILDDITPDSAGVNWNDYHSYDGTIFNPFETVPQVFGNMLSEAVCGQLLGSLEDIIGDLRDSSTITSIRDSFDKKISDFLRGDTSLLSADGKGIYSFLFPDFISDPLLKDDFYREFSFVVTIGYKFCVQYKANVCITRMHGFSMNLNGESQIFESRSIYLELPEPKEGVSSGSFVHFDFLANYLDVINKELGINVGLSAEIPGIENIGKALEQFQAHAGKVSLIPHIGDDIGKGIDFINDVMTKNTIILGILGGGASAKLGIIFGVGFERYQDVISCNGFRLSLSIGGVSSFDLKLYFGFEYRKEYGIPQSYHWIDDVDLPNLQEQAKMFWNIGKDTFNLVKTAINKVDDVFVDLVDDIDDSALDIILEILNKIIKFLEKIINGIVKGLNAIIRVVNKGLNAFASAFKKVSKVVNGAKNECKKIDNFCIKFKINLGFKKIKFSVCVHDIIKLDPFCDVIFKAFNIPLDKLHKALKKVNIPKISKLKIGSVSAAKQPGIVNIDEVMDGYDNEDMDQEILIQVPVFINVIFIVYSIVIAALFWFCGVYIAKMEEKDNKYVPVIWR